VTMGVPLAAKAFAMFSFLLAALAVFSFWPPKTGIVIVWLVSWTGLCVATGVAILRRQRHASYLVWAIVIAACLSAALALRSGLLGTMGIVIDVVLFVPLIWFAVWYQRTTRRGT
jgi:hypothetical protein